MLLDTKSLRLIIVGASAALLFFALSYAFIAAGGPPFASSTIAYAIAFIFAYSAQRQWTFGGAHSHARVFPRYLAAQVFCALLSGLVSHVSATVLGAPPFVISAASMLAGSAASFLLVRFWVFAHRDEN